jgi:hypothetical protein
LTAALLLAAASPAAVAQRPRGVESSAEEPVVNLNRPAPPAPPKVVKAKYMGGYGGIRQKRDGLLVFDDRNQRLVFLDKDEREVLSIAFEAIDVAFPDSETRQLMGEGTKDVMLGTMGPLALPGLLFKKKFIYLTIQFEDRDTELKGVTQFKMEDREITESVVYALAQKAGLVQRGQMYLRKKNKTAITEPASAEKKSNP